MRRLYRLRFYLRYTKFATARCSGCLASRRRFCSLPRASTYVLSLVISYGSRSLDIMPSAILLSWEYLITSLQNARLHWYACRPSYAKPVWFFTSIECVHQAAFRACDTEVNLVRKGRANATYQLACRREGNRQEPLLQTASQVYSECDARKCTIQTRNCVVLTSNLCPLVCAARCYECPLTIIPSAHRLSSRKPATPSALARSARSTSYTR
jgi:hypothetical protein